MEHNDPAAASGDGSEKGKVAEVEDVLVVLGANENSMVSNHDGPDFVITSSCEESVGNNKAVKLANGEIGDIQQEDEDGHDENHCSTARDSSMALMPLADISSYSLHQHSNCKISELDNKIDCECDCERKMDRNERGQSSAADSSRTARLHKILFTVFLYICLTIAVVFCASSGIVIKMLQDKGYSSMLSMAWRFQIMLIVFVPCAVIFVRSFPPNYFHWRTVARLFGIGACFWFWVATWAFSLNYTTVTLSFVFTSCHVIFIVVWRKISRQPVSWGEIIGAVIGFIGLILSTLESLMASGSGDGTRVLIGNLIALSGSIVGVAYFQQLSFRAQIPFFHFVIPVQLTVCVLFTVFACAAEGYSAEAIGEWTDPNIVLYTLFLGLVTGVAGIGIYQVISRYISSVVIAVSTLLQTIAATFLAWWLGVEPNPTALVWTGSVVMIFGCSVVIYYSNKLSQLQSASAGPSAADGQHSVLAASDKVDSKMDANVSPEQMQDSEQRDSRATDAAIAE
eukprot:ANDGO_00963.mRNA.1 hypothetical protein CAOG_02003